jgi:hypothetical protein
MLQWLRELGLWEFFALLMLFLAFIFLLLWITVRRPK